MIAIILKSYLHMLGLLIDLVPLLVPKKLSGSRTNLDGVISDGEEEEME